ncbi:response regulator [Azospirillum thermophilum]|uniref:Response regulator n=1 Tax=Azospirillum thermophilum TaxID=2202148 RepID=A0A2S2CV36_9PROT|nr:response regulator [Azospirillum thermophilum]AWK88275.1 response regulator [Azospirillum thermophilum]
MHRDQRRHRPFRILLVEDDPADAALAKRAIREGRILCDVRHVQDGEEALAYLRREPPRFADVPRPDLILLDLNMPRLDGRGVLKAVKQDEALRRIPVVVLTTSDADCDVEAIYRLGANSFVTKPMDLQDFFNVVAGLESYWFNIVKLPR